VTVKNFQRLVAPAVVAAVMVTQLVSTAYAADALDPLPVSAGTVTVNLPGPSVTQLVLS
jgi:hypothetical protein